MSEQVNTIDIIEFAYDLQAGTDIQELRTNPLKASNYFSEAGTILGKYTNSTHSLLDIGTGELTTLTGILNIIKSIPREIFAFDLSWSRLAKGVEYVRENSSFGNALNVFAADIAAIPLRSGSIDVITSSHALEPNGSRIKSLLAELFRVAKEKLILFEPCYEINSEEGKRRMDEHGYIKNVDGVVAELGGTVVERIELKNISNPLNPTVCFVVDVPKKDINTASQECRYSVPGTDLPLELLDNFYFSKEVGLSFPILRGIPIFREKYGIISTCLAGE
jgi:SAM-dependent methyltransferase